MNQPLGGSKKEISQSISETINKHDKNYNPTYGYNNPEKNIQPEYDSKDNLQGMSDFPDIGGPKKERNQIEEAMNAVQNKCPDDQLQLGIGIGIKKKKKKGKR